MCRPAAHGCGSPSSPGRSAITSPGFAWLATIYYNRDAFLLVWNPISVAMQIWWMTASPTWQLLGWWPQWPDLGSMWLCEIITFFTALHASADGVVKRYDARMERGSPSAAPS